MIFKLIGGACIGWAVGAGLSHVRSKLLMKYAREAISPEQLERMWVIHKATQIAASRKRKQEHIFAIAMRCNLQAATTEEQHKFLHDLHEEFMVAQGTGNAEDVSKLIDRLAAKAIFKGKLPILTDEEIAAEMSYREPAAVS